METMTRKPAVAGHFYPADPKALRDQIASFIKPIPTKVIAKGIVVPHAGYIYSGAVAGKVYSQIEIPDRIIILSPNHTGLGVPFSINNRGTWQLPMGEAQIDEKLADRLMKEFAGLEIDDEAHAREHSLEVQLPFLQFLKNTPSPYPLPRPRLRRRLRRGEGEGERGEGGFTFVPITLSHVGFDQCRQLGEAIARVIAEEKEPILIIASSDMNHYEDQQKTLQKDQWAIDKILKRDPEGLYKTVHDKEISMCGIIPATVMLSACNQLGATKVRLVDHKTSGDVNGDKNKVVGYAGLIID